jgi:hypothetical protein
MEYVLTLRSNRADSLTTDRTRSSIATGASSRPIMADADHVFSNINTAPTPAFAENHVFLASAPRGLGTKQRILE